MRHSIPPFSGPRWAAIFARYASEPARVFGHTFAAVTRFSRVFGALLQVGLLAAASWFLIRTARSAWPDLTQVPLDVSWGPLVLASVLTVLTYALLIRAWVSSLAWWQQQLRYPVALYIWFTTNLARFVPGAVWQFVGLAAMVGEHGVSPVAAMGAVLLQQLLFLATGLALSLVLAPQFLGAWVQGIPAVASASAAVLLLGGVVLGFPWLSPRLGRIIGRMLGREVPAPHPPHGRLVRYMGTLLLSWINYGIAFWLFGQALLGEAHPGVPLAVGAFTTSYVAGLLAVFAPGGLVVREAALVAALSPALGAPRALVLALGSRIWLLALEILTAASVIAWFRSTRTPPSSPSV